MTPTNEQRDTAVATTKATISGRPYIEKILTMGQARVVRDKLQENISQLVSSFESQVAGLKVESVSLSRPAKTDRRGVRTDQIACSVIVRLKEGSGFGSDL